MLRDEHAAVDALAGSNDSIFAREDAPQRIRQVVIAMKTRRSTPDRRMGVDR
jgi:hypothetical protein